MRKTHSSEVAYIPISHCVTGVARWAPSTALQMMVCLPGWHSTPFSPCHSLQGSNPSLTRGTDHTHWEKGNLSRPEVGKGVNAGNAVWAARAGRGGGEGGGDNEFFTVIKTERETLSVMMDQKYEDVKRSHEKKNHKAKLFSMVATEKTRGVSGSTFYSEDDQALAQLSREVVESPSLEVLKSHLDTDLG